VILVDTSVWIDHLRRRNPELQGLLEAGQVLCHPFVIGELAMGSLKQRETVLNAMQELPEADVARDDEVLRFLSERKLFGLGIGYIDAHLLAATQLTAGARLWTRDRRLFEVAMNLSLSEDGLS
jgi:predicted nucleic acid-binding protein